MYSSIIKKVSFFLVIILAPFQWLSLFQVLGLSIKPIHISLGLVGVAVIIGGNLNIWKRLFLGKFWFIYLYSLFLFWYVISLFWTRNLTFATPIVIKNSAYFFCFIIFMVFIIDLVRRGGFVKLAGVSALAGLAIYVIYMIYVFAHLGYNIFVEYYRAIISNDVQGLMFWFYPKLFNFSLAAIQDKDILLTNLRNTVMGGIIIDIILLNLWLRIIKSKALKVLTISFIMLGILLVLLSVSRSNTIILGLTLILPVIIRMRIKKRKKIINKKILFLIPVLLLGILISYFMFFSNGSSPWKFISSLSGILITRLNAIANDARWLMYKDALNQIYNNIIFGYGIGEPLLVAKRTTTRVHNVFLASWFETGFVGMFLSVLWYSIILVYWFKAIKSCRTWTSNIPIEWVATFPILPLLRVLESGSASFTLIEWLSLALFFGIIKGIKIKDQKTIEANFLNA